MSSNPSPAVAALLSFVFPGAGQVYAGQTRKGLIWAIPMVLFVIVVVWVLIGGQNRAFSLLHYETLLAILVLNVAFFFYHVAAMLDAYAVAQRERSRGYGYAGGAPSKTVGVGPAPRANCEPQITIHENDSRLR